MYKCQWTARPHWCGFWSLLRQLVVFCSFLIFTWKLHLILNYIMCVSIDTTQTYTYIKLKKTTVKNLLPSTISSAFKFRLLATNVMSFLFSSKTDTLWIKKQKHRFLPFLHKQYHPTHTLCILFFFSPLNLTWRCSDKNTWGESSFFYTATLTSP